MKVPKFDFKNIDWFSPKPSKERLVAGVAFLALVGGGYALSRAATGHAGPSPSPDAGYLIDDAGSQDARLQPARFGPSGGMTKASGPGPTPLRPLASGQCRTFAPQGWRISDQNRDGTVFTLTSAGGDQIANYSGLAINSGQVQGFYGPQYRTPETFALYAVGILTNEQARMTGPEKQVGHYQAITFATGGHQGYALLYRFPVPADPGGYGLIMRIAIGSNNARSVGIAGAVAAATRCNAITHPSTGPVYHAPRDDHGTSRTGQGSDSDLAGTYNAQLGTGWVHDSAGRNYNVDVTADYRENGPDGPGYYKVNGNDVTRLDPGMAP